MLPKTRIHVRCSIKSSELILNPSERGCHSESQNRAARQPPHPPVPCRFQFLDELLEFRNAKNLKANVSDLIEKEDENCRTRLDVPTRTE